MAFAFLTMMIACKINFLTTRWNWALRAHFSSLRLLGIRREMSDQEMSDREMSDREMSDKEMSGREMSIKKGGKI